MEYLKASRFKFMFFLSHKKVVPSLEDGAMKFGGATKVKDEIYSNFGQMDMIQVKEDGNEISIFIPSTSNVDEPTDNSKYLAKAYARMDKRFNNLEIIPDCKGSWLWETGIQQKVVIEDITIIKAYCKSITANDIMFMQQLAQEIKEDMLQEGVSIGINDALAIV